MSDISASSSVLSIICAICCCCMYCFPVIRRFLGGGNGFDYTETESSQSLSSDSSITD